MYHKVRLRLSRLLKQFNTELPTLVHSMLQFGLTDVSNVSCEMILKYVGYVTGRVTLPRKSVKSGNF